MNKPLDDKRLAIQMLRAFADALELCPKAVEDFRLDFVYSKDVVAGLPLRLDFKFGATTSNLAILIVNSDGLVEIGIRADGQ